MTTTNMCSNFVGFRYSPSGTGTLIPNLHTCTSAVQFDSTMGGRYQKPPKFEHIFVAVITSPPPFFCANTFDTSLLLSVCALS